MTETATNIKHEYHSAKFQKYLKEHKPKEACENCGVTERLEYHHIVPIYLGGTNNLGNITVLCMECHMKAHGAAKISALTVNNGRGRKRKIDNADSVFDRYRSGEIGTKECKILIKYSSGSKLVECPSYKEYLKERGIKRINNRVDFNATMGTDGVRSIIQYEDGRMERF